MIRIINSKKRLAQVQELLAVEFCAKKFVTVKITSQKRTINQNSYQFAIYSELEKQGDNTARYYRNYCKYTFGIDIRSAADLDFAEFIHNALKNLAYEQRIQAMEFIDVTKTFNTAQMKGYLRAANEHFTEQGFELD